MGYLYGQVSSSMSNTSVCPVCRNNEIPKEENYWVEIVSCSNGESNSVDQVFVCSDDCVTEFEGYLDSMVAKVLRGGLIPGTLCQ